MNSSRIKNKENVNFLKNFLVNNAPPIEDSEEILLPSQLGGDKDIPFGGFPPIYLCTTSTEITPSDSKKREYSTHKTAISIKDIMHKRRQVKV